jgi:hypothetical protein
MTDDGAPLSVPRRLTLHVSRHVREVVPEAFTRDLAGAAPAVSQVHVAPDLLAGAAQAGRRTAVRKAALALATGRVRDAYVARGFLPAAPGDESFELDVDGDAAPHALAALAGKLYDGERACQAALPLLDPGERSVGHVHVWATRRLVVTYSEEDFRYHARYAVHGYPTVFSVPALRYAPAPSRESQLERMRLASQGVPQDVIEQTVGQAFDHESFDAGDPATVTRALGSAALQACAIAAGARPFCSDPSCRLFNPHRSPEFLRSILGAGMCADHRRLLTGP